MRIVASSSHHDMASIDEEVNLDARLPRLVCASPHLDAPSDRR
jgi:hypothetical protein